MVGRTVIVAQIDGDLWDFGDVDAGSLAVKNRSTRSQRPGNNPNAPGVAFDADRFGRFPTKKPWVPSQRKKRGHARRVAGATYFAIGCEIGRNVPVGTVSS